MSEAEQAALMQAHNQFGAANKAAIRGGEALYPTTSATTVRIRAGKTLTTDGPFAETKEQLGGYYLVECANLDEAIAIAAQIPGTDTGSVEVRSVEVRPIVEFA
jgi:hypothetical protein